MGVPCFTPLSRTSQYSVAEFIDPDWKDKVKSGIRSSYLPARLHWLVGRENNPLPESTLSLSQGSMNSAVDPDVIRIHFVSVELVPESDSDSQ